MSGTRNQGILNVPPFPRVAGSAPVTPAPFNQAMAQIERGFASIGPDAIGGPYLPLAGGTMTGLLVGADVRVDGTFEANGISTFNHPVSVNDTLTVNGDVVLNSTTVTINSDATMTGNLTLHGNETQTGTLDITGALVLNGSTLGGAPAAGLVSSNGTVLEATTLGPNLSWTAGTLSVTTPISGVNAQTGTIYAIATTDLNQLITVSNTAAVAVSIAQAGTVSGFTTDWSTYIQNVGNGLVTITPATSTINGATTLSLGKFGFAHIVSDGANYEAMATTPVFTVLNSGYPAIVFSIPDSAATGGNARGQYATDLQGYGFRNAATQVASGNYSVVAGYQNTASGGSSVALGYKNVSSGGLSLAIGASSTASAPSSLALGFSVSTTGTNSLAIGSSASNSGANAVSISGQVSTDYGIAIGSGSQSILSGTASVAIGHSASAWGLNAVAVGPYTSATGTNSIVIGGQGTDRSNAGAVVFSPVSLGGGGGVSGRSQIEDYVLVSALGINGTATAAASAIVTSSGTATSGGSLTPTIVLHGSGYSQTPSISMSGGSLWGGPYTGGAPSFGTISLSMSLGTVNSVSISGSRFVSSAPSITIDPPLVRLTADAAFSASLHNVAALGSKTTQMFDCWIEITDTATGNFNTYYMASPGVMSQGTNAATTALATGSPGFTAGPTSGTPLSLSSSPTLTADTTNGGYSLIYGAPAGNSDTLYAVAELRVLNTRFN